MSGSVRRGPAWYLVHDKDGQVAELDRKLDLLDAEIHTLQTVRYEETRERLQRLGIDVSNYRPPPPLLEGEQRRLSHVRDDDDIEAIVAAAQEKPLDRAYREHIASRTAAESSVVSTASAGDPRLRRGSSQPA